MSNQRDPGGDRTESSSKTPVDARSSDPSDGRVVTLPSAGFESEDTPDLGMERATEERPRSSFLLKLESEIAAERFELRERLGHGGLGVVYAAYDRRRGELLALKTLSNLDGASIQHLKSEFRSLAGVLHPNLIRLRELFVDGIEVFFTMDLVEGMPLSVYLKQTAEPPSRPTLRETFQQLAHGLLAIHAAGQIHRDLKPSNVMVRSDGRVIILDFGVTCEVHSTKSGRVPKVFVGTPAYMSPEQALGDSLSPASDWYAFGVMLYEALAGRLPFEGTLLELLSAKTSKSAPPIERAGVPADLARLALLLLAREPDKRPTASEVVSRLGIPDIDEPAASTPAVSSGRTRFLGREAELLVLENALYRALHGELVSVLVTGTSGIGKSALVREFLNDDCRAKGALILESKCFEHESVRYNALDSVIDGLANYLRRQPYEMRLRVTPRHAQALVTLFPVLDEVLVQKADQECVPDRPAERRRVAVHALRELLVRVAEQLPLVLFLDDLQWGDRDSARLLSALITPPNPAGFLLIGACRSDERALSSLLQSLDTEAPDVWKPIEIEVGPLSVQESERLSLRLLGGSQRNVAESIAAEARGNPFFLLELCLAVQDSERDLRGTSLADLIVARIRSLAEPARHLLQIVALAEVPVAARLLEAAADLEKPGDDLWLVLKRAKLVRSVYVAGDERLLCYHDRIGEAVANSLESARAQALHRRLAHALQKDPNCEPERLVEHFRRADDFDKTRVYAERAGDAARRRLAFARAAKWYALAFELSSADEAKRTRLRILLAEVLEDAGHAREAARHYIDAAAQADEVAALDFRRRAASQLLGSGHAAEGQKVLETVLSAAGLRQPPATLPGAIAALVWERSALRLRGLGFDVHRRRNVSRDELLRVDALAAAAAGYLRCDFVRGAMFASKELRFALRTGDITRIARGLANEILFAANEGVPQAQRVSRLREIATGLLPRIEDERVFAFLKAACAASHLLLGEAWRAGPELRDAERMLAQGRASWELTLTRFLWGLCKQVCGDLVETIEPFDAWLADARERTDLQAERYFATYRSFALLVLDQPDAARENLVRTVAATEHASDDFMRFLTLHAFVLIAVYRQQGPDILEPLLLEHQKFWRSPLRAGQLSRAYVRIYTGYCLLVRAAHSPRARESLALRQTIRGLMQEGVPFAEAHGRLMRAAVLRLQGRVEEAIDELGTAASLFEVLRNKLQAGAANYQRGKLIGGDAGAELVNSALATARALHVGNPVRFYQSYTPGFWKP